MIKSRDYMETRSPLKFFLLVFALSIPFWLVGAASRLQLLPGLPLAALMFVCPAAAALILVYGENKTAGISALLERCFDFKRIRAKVWYVPAIFLMPGIFGLSYELMRLNGVPIPSPQISVPAVLAMFVVFLIAALGEELGWSAFITEPMQERWGALGAGILLGIVWAAWHFVPLLEANRSLAWIAWQSLFTVAFRVLIVWLYNNTSRSVFAAALVHDLSNVSWQIFPIHGSYYNPRVSGLTMIFVVVVVTVVWGPRTLAGRCH